MRRDECTAGRIYFFANDKQFYLNFLFTEDRCRSIRLYIMLHSKFGLQFLPSRLRL